MTVWVYLKRWTMFSRLIKWLKPPLYSGDENKTNLASILDKFLITVYLLQIVGFFIYPGPLVIRLLSAFALAVSALILQTLLRRGYFDLANCGSLVTYWLVVSASIIVGGGVHAAAFSALTLLVIWATFSSGKWGAVLMIAASTLTGAFSVAANKLGWINFLADIDPPLNSLAVQVIILIALAVVTYQVTLQLRTSVQKARNEVIRHQKTQKELARFKEMSEQARDVIVMIDPETNHILYANQAASKTYGYSQNKLCQLKINDLRTRETQAQIQEKMKHETENGLLYEALHQRQDGSTFPVEISARKFNFEGDTILINIIRDITDRKLVEAELQKLNLELEDRVRERTSQLETANKELEAFCYSASHDLRTPLRAMNGFAQVLDEDFGKFIPQEGKSYLKRIKDSSIRMDQLIDDLLMLSRLGSRPFIVEQVDPAVIAMSAWEELGVIDPQRQIHFSIADDLPYCMADADLLEQVFVNLLSNAIKFTRLQKQAEISIGWSKQNNEVVYWVKDNGIGIDMQYANKLFLAFQRLHIDKQFEGTGIGLAIVQRIIQRHHGRIWVESQPNQGATFYFTFNPLSGEL
jgi:PAS domain S-box-containing protein